MAPKSFEWKRIASTVAITGALLCAAPCFSQAGDTLHSNSVKAPDTLPPKSDAKVLDQPVKPAPEPLYRPANLTPPPLGGDSASQEVNHSTLPPAGSDGSNNSGDYTLGRMNGQSDARGNGLWFLAGSPGLCCYGAGGLGILFAILIPPEPPTSALIGKSSAYILGYTEGYQSKGRWKNAGWASIGCAISTALSLLLMYTLVGFNTM